MNMTHPHSQVPDTAKALDDPLHLVASRLAIILRRRNETVAIAETSSGGLASAALLGIPGASAFFVGAAVLYSRQARIALTGISEQDLSSNGIRPETEPYARLLAKTIRGQLNATWGLGESGASGPSPSPYGDPPGHVCISVSGPYPLSLTLETGDTTRSRNMTSFAIALLSLLEDAIAKEEAKCPPRQDVQDTSTALPDRKP